MTKMALRAVALSAACLPSFVSAATIEKVKVNASVDLITIAGEIVAGDDQKFINLALSSPRSMVALESNGGALETALEIGRGIRLKGFSTWVPDGASCSSACALIWLAGLTRLKSTTGRVGFHASYTNEDGRASPTAVGNALVGRYLTQLDLPQQAVVFATEAPPEEIEWLSSETAQRAGITFTVFDLPKAREVDRPNPAAVSGAAMNGLAAAIKHQVQACYHLGDLAGTPAMQIVTTLRIRYKKDGSLAGNPQLVEQTGISPANRAYAKQIEDVARRAVLRCAPVHLPAELYEGGWDDLNFRFTPGQMQ